MRTAILLVLLTAIQSAAAERTWTIARDVYQADGELVAVRGDVAFLRIDGKVEEIPIERLSAPDQYYISSLSLAPILPGPSDNPPNFNLPAADAESTRAEEMPLPGSADDSVKLDDRFAPREPELAPEYGGMPLPRSDAARAPYRFDRYGRIVPPQSATPANYLAPQQNWGDNFDPNDRRGRRATQDQNGRDSRAERDNDDDDRGIFGFRARRQERQRSAANRNR